MKNRTLVSILILAMGILIVVGSCTTGKKAYKVEEDEELFGIWINPEYDETWRYSKVIIKPDGTWIEYKMSDGNKPILEGEYTVSEKWSDSDSNVFYKIIVTRPDIEYVPYYLIARIDKTGNVYEDLWTTAHMPDEFDPDNVLYNYRIYYRQE